MGPNSLSPLLRL